MSLGKWQWLANNLSKCFKSAGFTAKKQHHVGHVVCWNRMNMCEIVLIAVFNKTVLLCGIVISTKMMNKIPNKSLAWEALQVRGTKAITLRHGLATRIEEEKTWRLLHPSLHHIPYLHMNLFGWSAATRPLKLESLLKLIKICPKTRRTKKSLTRRKKVPIPKDSDQSTTVNHCQPLIGSCQILALHSLHCHGCRTRSLETPHTAGAIPRQLEETLSCGWRMEEILHQLMVYPCLSHIPSSLFHSCQELPTATWCRISSIHNISGKFFSGLRLIWEYVYRLPSGKLRVCYWKWPLK